jgi:phage anti-repressor protein
MNELIKITEKDNQQVVSARELHTFLESKQDFSTWIKNRIEKYKFVRNEDYTCFHKKMEANNATKIEYAITLDMAKELAMVEGNERGKQIRKYFIECERKLKQQKPLSQSEILLQSAQLLVDIEKKQNNMEIRLKAIEEHPAINDEIENFTILGYCNLIGRQVNRQEASTYGKLCSTLCRKRGLSIGRIKTTMWGIVGSYPLDVLKEIIGE